MNPTVPTRAATVLLAVVLAATALLAVPSPATALSTYTNVEQLAVDSFVEAGLAVSQRSFDPEATTSVVLATDANFPDGLTASAVAGAGDAPVLFTGRDALDPATAAEIDRLLDEGDTVVVMGGTEAIGDAVTAELEQYEVVRLAGPSRIETAVEAAEAIGIPAGGRVLIARAFGPDGAGTPSDRSTGWVDAISCGAFAAAQGIPILLTQTEVLTASTRDLLAGSTAAAATICGGPAAVSDQVAAELISLGLEVDRVEGVTRVETAVAVAQDLFGQETAAGGAFAVVPGYGERFGYGLAAAPLGLPILLVGAEEPTACTDGSQPSRATLCYLQTGEGDAAEILLVGDETVIADAVANAVGEAAGGRDISTLPLLAAPGGVEAEDDLDDDGTRLSVSWTAPADPDDILAGYRVRVDGTVAEEVQAGTTQVVLEDLEPDEEVEVTVTAVDLANRESSPSATRRATPTDEVPAALTGADADAGDDSVALSWDRGPVDAASYAIQRTTTGTTGACGTYADLATVADPDTTTYTDDTATNGTTYCYRITVTDAAGQTSAPAETGTVTPAPGTPQVAIQSPVFVDGGPFGTDQVDTVHYGLPLQVEYTLTDTDDDPADLRVTLEMSYQGSNGAGGTPADTYRVVGQRDQAVAFTTPGEDGAATFTVPLCPVGDTTGLTCIRDAQLDTLAFRITVEDASGLTDTDTSGAVQLRRTPPAVANLAVTGAQGRVNLVWDRLVPATGVVISGYQITRAATDVAPGSDAGVEACPTTGYTQIAVQPQPTTAQVRYTDTAVDADGTTIGGTQVSDTLYCYRVAAQRTVDGSTLTGPVRLGAGNPLVGAGVTAAFQSPPNGGKLDRGADEVIRYVLDVPDGEGVTVQSVELLFCRDYDVPDEPFATEAECLDPEGFKPITTANGLATAPPAQDGTNQVTWRVPADGTTAQADGATGALEIRVSASNGSSSGRVTGILFR